MIAGQSFNLLEAIYIVVCIGSLYLACMAVLLNLRTIIETLGWMITLALADGPRALYRVLRHEVRAYRHRAWMRSHMT